MAGLPDGLCPECGRTFVRTLQAAKRPAIVITWRRIAVRLLMGPVAVGLGGALIAVLAHIGAWGVIPMGLFVACAGVIIGIVAVLACTRPAAIRLWGRALPDKDRSGPGFSGYFVASLLLATVEFFLLLGAWALASAIPLQASSGGP